jgi:hypothetical protein
MGSTQYTEEANDEDTLAQQYYDLVVTVIKPKIKEYLNVNVSRKILEQRINECRDYYIRLSDIQYEISKFPPDKELKYTKTGDTKPEGYKAEAIDTQAKNWLNRLSTTITFMVIKMSEYDVKNSFRRDIIICIISVFLSILSGVLISRFFSNKEISCLCYPTDPVINTIIGNINNDNTNEIIEQNNKAIEIQNDQK